MLIKYGLGQFDYIKEKYSIQKENYKRLEEDENFIYEVFDNAPIFFSTLWETVRRTGMMQLSPDTDCNIYGYIGEYRDLEFLSDFKTTIIINHLKYDIYADEDRDRLAEEFYNLFYDEYEDEIKYLINNFYDIYSYTESDGYEESEDTIIGCGAEFFTKILLPIYEGKYNSYLEKIFRQTVIKCHLT